MSRAWKFGDDVDTDAIVPARYLNTSDARELAAHVMEDTGNDAFKDCYQQGKNPVEGDVFVGGENFGCGSSREHAPLAVKTAGVIVVAKSFARIFYRNAFNIGLTVVECAEAGKIEQGDNIEVLLGEGMIVNHTKDEQYSFAPMPEFMQKLVAAGGLMPYVARELGYTRAPEE
jgi:3-isopropylmalate/(R)-2-methylmalate dehydratase small subunit